MLTLDCLEEVEVELEGWVGNIEWELCHPGDSEKLP